MFDDFDRIIGAGTINDDVLKVFAGLRGYALKGLFKPCRIVAVYGNYGKLHDSILFHY